MNRANLVAFASILLLAGLTGCKAETDLGQECRMTKPNPDGTSTDISADSVSDSNLDYVALGSAECDDLVCIRTKGSQNPDNVEGLARGYCTAPCIDNSNCSPDFQGHKGALHCERLLLDQTFLDHLKESDPATYEQTFGSGASAKYCVLPRAQ